MYNLKKKNYNIKFNGTDNYILLIHKYNIKFSKGNDYITTACTLYIEIKEEKKIRFQSIFK